MIKFLIIRDTRATAGGSSITLIKRCPFIDFAGMGYIQDLDPSGVAATAKSLKSIKVFLKYVSPFMMNWFQTRSSLAIFSTRLLSKKMELRTR